MTSRYDAVVARLSIAPGHCIVDVCILAERLAGVCAALQVKEGTHRAVLKRLLDIASRSEWFKSQHVSKLLRRHMDPIAVQRILAKLGASGWNPLRCVAVPLLGYDCARWSSWAPIAVAVTYSSTRRTDACSC